MNPAELVRSFGALATAGLKKGRQALAERAFAPVREPERRRRGPLGVPKVWPSETHMAPGDYM